jgi:hypothetical protein
MVFPWITYLQEQPDEGVPGFTGMADGFVIPQWFGGITQTGEFVFALENTEFKTEAVLETAVSASSAQTLVRQDANTDYQVPAGKSARVVLIIDIGTGTTGGVTITHTASADATGGTVLQTFSNVTSSTTYTSKILTVPASRYLTIERDGTGTITVATTSTMAFIAETV